MQGPYTRLIDWQERGKPDYLLGAGYTRSEQLLAYGASLAACFVVLWLNFDRGLGWSWWQIVVALAVAADVAGGVVANSLNSCKRTYHAPLSANPGLQERLLKNHLLFVLLHIHPVVVGLLIGGGWQYGLLWYAAVVLSTLLVLATPLYLRRPVAIGLCLAAVFLAFYISPISPGFEWFGPALFLKLIYGHLVPEEPYRPQPASSLPQPGVDA